MNGLTFNALEAQKNIIKMWGKIYRKQGNTAISNENSIEVENARLARYYWRIIRLLNDMYPYAPYKTLIVQPQNDYPYRLHGVALTKKDGSDFRIFFDTEPTPERIEKLFHGFEKRNFDHGQGIINRNEEEA